MTAGAFCNRDVVVTESETSVYDAAKLMREHHVGCLVVVDKKDSDVFPVGLVTDRDLVIEVLAQEVDPDPVAISDIMSTDLVTVHESDSLWDTIKTMKAHGIRRIPVVSDGGALAGLLTVDDLLDLLSTEISQLTYLIENEQEREKESRP